ncbi:MAG: RHS repeat protein [Lachnospiraceae bacterium]|nr:RHS repeat protein [Lachnospiraceae bacterium]
MKITRKIVSMCLAMTMFVTMFTVSSLDVKAEETVILTVDAYDYGSQLNLNFAVNTDTTTQKHYDIRWYYNGTLVENYTSEINTTGTYITSWETDVSDCFGGNVSGEVTVMAKAFLKDTEVAASNEVVITVAEERLNTVENIRLEGTTLMWDAVEGAESYNVNLSKKTGETSYTQIFNGKVQDVTLDISEYTNELDMVRVRALSGDCTSYLNSEFTNIKVADLQGGESISGEKKNTTENVSEKNTSSEVSEEKSVETTSEKADGGKSKKNVLASILSNLFVFNLSGCGHQHTWSEATCAAPKTCADCGQTEGEMLEHTWVEATYTEPKTCSVCSTTEGTSIPVCVAKEGNFTYEEYEYDTNGVKIGATTYYVTKTNYEYDSNGNLIEKIQNGLSELKFSYEYDANRNMIKETTYESDGDVSCERNYTYDLSNRLVAEEMYDLYFGDPYKAYEAFYEYNTDGLLTKETWTDYQMGIWTGESIYEYDAEGRRISEQQSSVYDGQRSEARVEYVYDADGSGYTTNYLVGGGIYSTSEYDQNNQVIKSQDFSAGIETTYEYDEKGNVSRKIDKLADSSEVISEYDNEYDDNGKLVCVAEKSFVSHTKYEYDANGYLIHEITDDEDKVVYENDTYGNPICITRTGSISGVTEYSYEYDASGNMLAKIYPNGNKVTYEYNTDGNLVKETSNYYEYIYEYDNNNKLVKLTTGDGSYECSYEYDENGNMIREIEVDFENGVEKDSYITEYIYAPVK